MSQQIPPISNDHLISWIALSMNNDLNLVKSKLHQDKYPEQVKESKQSAEAAKRVIECLRKNDRPTTPLGTIWYEWFVGWATVMIVFYKGEYMIPDKITGISRFTIETSKVREERDKALAKLAAKG